MLCVTAIIIIVVVLLIIINLSVGSRAADRCTVSTSAADFGRQATATNPHSLREQAVRIRYRKEHGYD